MTRHQTHWLRYSNLVPMIFTALVTLISITMFITTISNKLDYISQEVIAIQKQHEEIQRRLFSEESNKSFINYSVK